MVVLTKIEPSFFKSLGFKNRTSGITFIKYVLQVIPNKYKTENDLKKYLQPKISNLESLGININDKANSKIYKTLKELKKLESKKGKKIQEKIDKNLKELEKQINSQTWHITGTIIIKIIYNFSDNRGKEYIYEKEEKQGGIYKGIKNSAIEEFKNDMFTKYNRVDPSPDIEYIVKEIIIDSIIQVNDKITKIEDMSMKHATQLEYNIIDEYKNFLQNNGTCVIDNFIGLYGESLGITRKYFKCLVKEYYKQYNINWTVEDGISPKCVSSICEKYDIAHYAFDVNKNCFIKNISKYRKNKALVYFAVNNHMYLILDDAVKKSLIERTKVKESF